MKFNKLISLPAVLLLLISPVLLFTGCGSAVEQPISKDMGCPSGSYLANATDTITASPSVNPVVDSFYFGGTILYTPVTFKVTDSNKQPRNNVCLLAYTGDTSASPGPYWYTDAAYNAFITGTGPFNARAIVTDDSGVAMVFWSTAELPASNPRVMTSPGPPPTFTAGKDQTGTSYIQVYSGSLSATFNVNWTVKGEPAS